MSRFTAFLLRTAFLAFFALNAWNNLKDLDSFHPAFAKSYQNFEKSLTSKTGLKFPNFMSSAFIEQNSLTVAKGLSWAQLALCGAAWFVWSGFTALVGLTYFLVTIIQLNAAKLDLKTGLTELEPFLLALGLFAGSLALSCSGSFCNKRNNRNIKTEDQSARVTGSKRR